MPLGSPLQSKTAKQEIVNGKVCTSTSPTSEFIVEVKVKVLAPGLTKRPERVIA